MSYGYVNYFGQSGAGGYGSYGGMSNDQIDSLLAMPDAQFGQWLSTIGSGGYGGNLGNSGSGIGGAASSAPWNIGGLITGLGGLATAGAGLKSLFGGSSAGGTGSVSQQLSPQQQQLLQSQLQSIQGLQPFQQQLQLQALQQLAGQNAYQGALDTAITPTNDAASQAQQFNFANSLTPVQQQLQQMQLQGLLNNGQATPAQLAQIQMASDAAIKAGSSDIDVNTQRGIDMISDQLANSRGLRLSDSPITSEAALLARAGSDQKSSLVNNVRASQANAALNYPLAVQGLQSGINLSQQNANSQTQQFQDQLRQAAYQNRLSLVNPTATTGLGLSGIRSSVPASGTTTTNQTPSLSQQIGNVGSIFQGASAAYPALSSIFSNL